MSTGYEGNEGEDKFVGEQRWILKNWLSPIATGVMGVLEVYEDNKRSVRGHIEFKDEEEFNWLKRRIDGGHKVEREKERKT